jgi:hypothetical protein
MASIATVQLNDRVKDDTFASVQFEYNEGGSPLDITGNSVKIQFRQNSERGALLYEATSAVSGGITLTNPSIGIFKLDEFTPTEWEKGYVYFDVEMTFVDGSVRTWIKGRVNILQETTKTI